MAKTSIVLGFSEGSVETSPGVYETMPVEIAHRADVLVYNKNYDLGEEVNDEMRLKNRYSIVMKDTTLNYEDIKYVIVKEKRWRVSGVEFLYPRLILTLGGLYHAE